MRTRARHRCFMEVAAIRTPRQTIALHLLGLNRMCAKSEHQLSVQPAFLDLSYSSRIRFRQLSRRRSSCRRAPRCSLRRSAHGTACTPLRERGSLQGGGTQHMAGRPRRTRRHSRRSYRQRTEASHFKAEDMIGNFAPEYSLLRSEDEYTAHAGVPLRPGLNDLPADAALKHVKRSESIAPWA
jgi:hypothetical protein